MIRKLLSGDIDRVADIWSKTNLKAHYFISNQYWKSNYELVKEMLSQSEVYVFEADKICRVTGKRIKTWAMLFCLGGLIDFIKLGAGIIIVSVFFIILLVFHLVDMTINRDKYRV